MIYDKIYDFCKVKNLGSTRFNSSEAAPPRVSYLMKLLTELNISFKLDRFYSEGLPCYNLILPGTSDKMLMAHHDIVNPESDNANDNSCSVINAIAAKQLVPEITVALVDGEELGGLGSQRVADQILAGEFGKISWVLNLELTGIGGERFFIGTGGKELGIRIVEEFNCPVIGTPFNDAMILRENGIDSVVINPVPIMAPGEVSMVKFREEYLDTSILGRCHSKADSVDLISTSDMRAFVEKVLVKIV